MIGEWLSDIRTYFVQRLNNPVLAPFSVAWVVSNWKLVLFLLFSEQNIEAKITYVQQNYFAISHLLMYPLTFALAYALILPSVHLYIEQIQDKANLQRRIHRVKSNTKYLKASVEQAEAQADLNRILAQDEITRRQQEELEQLRRQADEADAVAQKKIAAAEAEFKSRFEALENGESTEQQLEVEKLRQQLEDERRHALEQQERAQIELRNRQTELERRLADASAVPLATSDVDFQRLLLSRPFRLFHNPKIGPERSKVITFLADGLIGDGQNRNEHSWRIANGKLELVQQDGKVHSRFYFLPPSRIFVHTGDRDTRSARGQYIVPETR